MHRPVNSTLFAVPIFLAGFYLLMSLLLYLTGFEGVALILGPGSFFYDSYSFFSFYVPLYLFVVAGMLWWKKLSKPLLFAMTLASVPLMTLAVIVQLLTGQFGTAAKVLAEVFGGRVGASLLLLLTALELGAIYILSMSIFYNSSPFRRREQKLLSPPPKESEPENREEAPPALLHRDDGKLAFPDIPELPKLRVFESQGSEEKAPAEEPTEEPVQKLQEEEFVPEDKLSLEVEEGPIRPERRNDPFEEPDKTPKRKSQAARKTGEFAESLVEPKVDEEETVEPFEEHDEPEKELQEFSEENAEPDEELGEPFEAEETEVEPSGEHEEDPNPSPVPHEAGVKRKFTYKNYSVPEEELLKEYPDRHYWVIDEETRQWAEVLKNTLEEFKISAEVTGIQKGPVITMFEILPAPGVKLSKIVNLADNIALRLAASRVRIVAPIPGKHAVGIEVPNKKRSLVSFREMLQSEVFQEADMNIPIILGKDITGETQIVDLTQTPHLLIAGATGSGKSVCVNSIICSVLYTRSPDEVRMVLIDPKIVELKLYNDIPHLLTPVITEAKRAFQVLQYLLYEMERRYSLLDSLGVRDIKSYNHKIKRKRLATEPLPYIVVIVDEFADLMATSGKELESTLARLAAMSRAVGIHLVLATQRPSIDVITGLIKANIPSRIAFMVAGKFDSRIIIDSVGAEKLLGQGDMLFTSAWNPHPTRIQGAYLSEEEVEHIAEYVRGLGEPDYIDEDIFFDDDEDDWNLEMGSSGDPLLPKAVEVISNAGKASASYLQRRLKIGYNRAARIIEEMEDRGIVGPQNGSKPRDILHIPDEFRE